MKTYCENCGDEVRINSDGLCRDYLIQIFNEQTEEA